MRLCICCIIHDKEIEREREREALKSNDNDSVVKRDRIGLLVCVMASRCTKIMESQSIGQGICGLERY